MKSVQENSNRDEFTVFGKHIAHQLRNISDIHAQHVAQHWINNTLFEVEISKFHPAPLNCTSGTTAKTSYVSELSPSLPYSNPQTQGYQGSSNFEGGYGHLHTPCNVLIF
jgi:hypothetical protein